METIASTGYASAFTIMTDELRKLIMSKQKDPKPLTPAQESRIDCALNLYRLAEGVVGYHDTSDNARLRILCTAGALAEAYAANLTWLNELLREKYGRPEVSADETVDAWRRLFEWIVRDGIRPPITLWNGVEYVQLPFQAVHARIVGAYRDVKAFRRGIRK